MRADDRGVSEAIGFVFIFAMVILSIALVSVSGFAGLEHVRDAERVNNAENAFDVLAANVDDLVHRGAPSRSTEVTLDDASLSVGEPITVRVSGTSASGSFDDVYQVRPLVYEDDTGTKLVFVNGAVIREDRDGVVMLREPALLVTPTETAITLVNLEHEGDAQSVGGSTTVNVRTTKTGRELVVAETDSYQVTYEVTSPHAAVWERSLNEPFAGGCTRTDDTVTCTTTTDRVYVTVVETDVRFD